MTYPDFVAARQYIAERRFGAPLRAQQLAAVALEDAQFARSVEGLKRTG